MEDVTKQIKYIDEMIAAAKGNLAEGRIYYLLWGWLVFSAATIEYILLKLTTFQYHWLVWPLFMGAGAIASIVIGVKELKTKIVTTKIDKILGQLWLGFSLTLLVTLSGLVTLGPLVIYPMLMALYGMATFVSGGIINFRPLQVGAVAAWVCAALSFYQTQFADHLILLAAAILFSYIIPGHLLSARR